MDAIRVPAPMRENTTEIAQPLDRAWTNRMDAIRVPAPMKAGFATIKTNQRKRLSKRELNIDQHYGCSRVGAWTNRTDRIRVPAPMREDTTEIAQPLDRAWTNRMDAIRVPAPRLELGTP